MAIYTVRMDHPDGNKWNQFVLEHVLYLKDLIKQGKLLASGPLKETPLRAGFLIMQAENEDEVKQLVAADPFSRENLIVALRIEKWDPLFGMLTDKSSKSVPPELASLFEE